MSLETEGAYLQRYPAEVQHRFPRSEHTVDIALFTIQNSALSVLLVERGEHPERGNWALPGGFVRLGTGESGQGESLDAAAERELAEETGIDVFPGYLEQLRTYGDPGRDPRGRVFSTAYVGIMPNVPTPRAGGDAAASRFFAVEELVGFAGPALAFDHATILRDALERVRSKVEYDGRVAAAFLSSPFTISDLRRVYEAIWGGPIHRGDFRRKVLSSPGYLVATGERSTRTGGPPAELYLLGSRGQLHPPMLQSAVLLKDDRSAGAREEVAK
jgi:8-oxo-dGTP diphosphatase